MATQWQDVMGCGWNVVACLAGVSGWQRRIWDDNAVIVAKRGKDCVHVCGPRASTRRAWHSGLAWWARRFAVQLTWVI